MPTTTMSVTMATVQSDDDDDDDYRRVVVLFPFSLGVVYCTVVPTAYPFGFDL